MAADVINANPTKPLFLEMFTRDISLEDCVLDLVDNSLDSLIRSQQIDISDAFLPQAGPSVLHGIDASTNKLPQIKIQFDDKHFRITDNCGGIPVQDAIDEVFRFGHTAQSKASQLGMYGIGLKRAIFKMGKHITIESRTQRDGIRVVIDVPEWTRVDHWTLPLERIEKAPSQDSAGTSITVKNLNQEVSQRLKSDTIDTRLSEAIAQTYCLFLSRYMTVILKGHKISPMAIPLGSSERVNIAKDSYTDGDVTVTLYAGLAWRGISKQWRAADAGWYAACNGRFVVVHDQTELTGWGGHPGPIFVPKYRGFVGVALFNSQDPFALPWTTTKRGLNRESLVYQRARERMAAVATPILRL